ncbi:ABC transporter permease [Intestinimonas butyriciproducens]|uniref:ABC transporter permease n=1 Tax=Intestinimonas butyriciproducens TaxID=1297617 RepID=UPI0024323946|nr:ABC transporter permease [Intestinimonas butyriciproducens]MCI6363650.1 ABC transporter permease [Intestinimonas butyriciproducens]MDY3616629.1 ABC transporter permease [Intestinimonas butyriciproducens]
MRVSILVKRLLEALFIVFCIITINFVLVRFMPGDPVVHIIGEDEYLRLEAEAPEVIEEVRRDYGLDQPLWVQYVTYLNKTVHLDFGNSYRTKLPVLETVMFRMRWTILLAIPAILISALLGGWLGLRAGWRKGGLLDTVCSPIMLLLNTIPTNCMAIIFLLVFAFRMWLFPISGITSGGLTGLAKAIDILWHMALPLAVLALLRTSSYYMLMKSTVQTIRDEEYIAVARSKGFSQEQVLLRHVLKNALCPYLTSVCMQFGHILGGSMLVEVVFSWKGMGTLIYDAVNTKDFPMLQTCFLFIGICVVLFNLLADVLNLIIDPRTRGEDSHA